jgi:Flp pilus assembly protein TadD
MAKVCPKCGADNNDLARYCDQCAVPLSPEASTEAAAKSAVTPGAASSARINWLALLIVAVVIMALSWLLFAPHESKPGASADAAAMGAGGGTENPHTKAGADAAGGMNGDIMQQISDAKSALEKNPLDTDALNTIYGMYGTIGRQQQVRPYLDKAYAELIKQRAALGDKAVDTLVGLVSAAMMGGDADGALSILTQYQQLEPDNTSLLGILGDVCSDMDKKEDAIKWYTLYLDKAKPEEAGETYWRVRTDRAVMFLKLGQPVNGQDSVQLAISELEGVTLQVPALWGGWFNLGIAYSTAGLKDKAKQAWDKALKLSTGELDKWQVEAEIAKMEGKEPPPQPANPHGAMGAGGGMGMGGGMTNPHGGDAGGGDTANPHGGMSNPHGGMGGAPGQDSSGG